MPLSIPTPTPYAIPNAVDPTTGFDWGQLLIVIATVLTAIATLYAIWQRFHYNRRPKWQETSSGYPEQTGNGSQTEAIFAMKIANVGDGPAFNVTYAARGSTDFHGNGVKIHGPIARVESGREIGLSVWLPVLNGRLELQETTLKYADDRVLAEPNIYLDVNWFQSPRLNHPRKLSFRLKLSESVRTSTG